MAESIVLASGVWAQVGDKPDKDAVFDLWAFREMELQLSVLNVSITGSPSWATLALQTSMDPSPKAQWQALGAFTQLPVGGTDIRRFSRFLRYVRWQVMGSGDGGVLFNLGGMAW